MDVDGPELPPELAHKKAIELPVALADAMAITKTNVLLGALNVLKNRFRWIKSFRATPKGKPCHFKIELLASEHTLDEDYSEGTPEKAARRTRETANIDLALVKAITKGEVLPEKKIGDGAFKDVFTLSNNKNVAIAIEKTGKYPEIIEKEYESIQKLKRAGLPVVDAEIILKIKHPETGVETRGLLMPLIEGFSSSAAEINETTLKALSSEAKANALSDLSRIQDFIANNTIGDFQVLMDGKTGFVYIHDPQKILMGKVEPLDINKIQDWLDMLGQGK